MMLELLFMIYLIIYQFSENLNYTIQPNKK